MGKLWQFGTWKTHSCKKHLYQRESRQKGGGEKRNSQAEIITPKQENTDE